MAKIAERHDDEARWRRPCRRRPFGESSFELSRGDGRGHGQGDNLAYSALGSGVNAERLDRRRDPEVCICGFARHAR